MEYATIEDMTTDSTSIDTPAEPVEAVDTSVQLPAIRRNQRLVLQHTTGPHAGLFQILGHTDELDGADPEPFYGSFDLTFPEKRSAPISLVASKRGYVLYREIFTPVAGMKGFEKGQR
jgi:hypothetical protein